MNDGCVGRLRTLGCLARSPARSDIVGAPRYPSPSPSPHSDEFEKNVRIIRLVVIAPQHPPARGGPRHPSPGNSTTLFFLKNSSVTRVRVVRLAFLCRLLTRRRAFGGRSRPAEYRSNRHHLGELGKWGGSRTCTPVQLCKSSLCSCLPLSSSSVLTAYDCQP